jgi:disabled family protein 2
MCQDALLELKTAIKASGEHKQKVWIHIAVDGLKIRDEKTGVYLMKLSIWAVP